MRMIQSEGAPSPGGHYSQAVEHGGLIFTAGLLPVVPGTLEKVLGSIEEQTTRVLQNLGAILEAAGSGPEQVLRTTVYISDITLWGRVNEVYTAFFGDHRPARTVVPTTALHHGFAIEIDAVAVTAGASM